MTLGPGTASLDRDIFRLALPALATLVAEPLYVLTDTAIVGHLGTEQLAGLAVASGVLLSAYAICIFLAYGTTSAVGRLLGGGRVREAGEQAVQGLWLAAVLGVALAVGMAVFARPLVWALGGRGAVAAEGLVYLRISLVGLPALLTSLAGVGYLRGRRDTITPLVVAGGTALANLAIESVLIFGLGFGIGASALSTVIAQYAGAALLVWRVGTDARAAGAELRPRPALMSQLLKVGSQLMIRTAALRGSLILGTAAAARLGDARLGGYQIGFEVWSFLALALDALAIAAQALVAHALGAGDVEAARRVGRRINLYGAATGAVFGMALYALRSPLAQVFSDDEAVIAATLTSLAWVAASQPVNGVVFALDGILIGAGDMAYLARAMAVAFALFCPMALLLIRLQPGLNWLWAALTAFMLARLVGLAGRFRQGGWAVPGAERRS